MFTSIQNNSNSGSGNSDNSLKSVQSSLQHLITAVESLTNIMGTTNTNISKMGGYFSESRYSKELINENTRSGQALSTIQNLSKNLLEPFKDVGGRKLIGQLDKFLPEGIDKSGNKTTGSQNLQNTIQHHSSKLKSTIRDKIKDMFEKSSGEGEGEGAGDAVGDLAGGAAEAGGEGVAAGAAEAGGELALATDPATLPIAVAVAAVATFAETLKMSIQAIEMFGQEIVSMTQSIRNVGNMMTVSGATGAETAHSLGLGAVMGSDMDTSSQYMGSAFNELQNNMQQGTGYMYALKYGFYNAPSNLGSQDRATAFNRMMSRVRQIDKGGKNRSEALRVLNAEGMGQFAQSLNVGDETYKDVMNSTQFDAGAMASKSNVQNSSDVAARFAEFTNSISTLTSMLGAMLAPIASLLLDGATKFIQVIIFVASKLQGFIDSVNSIFKGLTKFLDSIPFFKGHFNFKPDTAHTTTNAREAGGSDNAHAIHTRIDPHSHEHSLQSIALSSNTEALKSNNLVLRDLGLQLESITQRTIFGGGPRTAGAIPTKWDGLTMTDPFNPYTYNNKLSKEAATWGYFAA